eukprot:TRINITY_DN21716_c0_g1_i1.p1 TRINITY_DN21716_c0_g1~~TRINITY_DN21716_c0_g1_i1.p1  ORF type:complete len:176 (+),score=77.92 TRINITY_DN21716_c0_g1_i1:74-601(+)
MADDGKSGWKGFGAAFSSVLDRDIKENVAAPVLAETQVEKKIKEKKAEMREKKLQSLAKKAEKDKGHAKPDITQKAFELQLRKVATQGVVTLFNAVKDFQSRGQDTSFDAKAALGKTPIKERGQKMEKAAKQAFSDILEKRKAGEAGGDKKKKKGATITVSTATSRPEGLDEFDS